MTHRNITSEECLEFIHDLRSPLTAIRNWTELMERDPGVNYLKKLLRNVDRAESLIASFLDKGTRPRREELCLKEVVIEAVDEIFAGRPGRCTSSLDDDVVGHWDAMKLRRAIVNLLDNAAKHSPAETPIRIRVTREGNHALCSIRNQLTASGFDPGYTSDEIRKSGAKGWGLGLSIVHKVIRECEGDVVIEKPSATEVEFTIRLPLPRAS